MRYTIAVLFIHVVYCVPVKRKLSDAELSKELGDQYSEYEDHKRLVHLNMTKKWYTAKPDERNSLLRKWAEELRQRQERSLKFEPGSESEFKKVWHDDDGMEEENYSPDLFFKTHDVDGDGYLSDSEIRAIPYARLVDLYSSLNATDEELMELEAELAKVRNLRDFDTDKDGRISQDEFVRHSWKKDTEDYPLLIDQEELPDFDHLKSYVELREAALKQLRLHPNDAELEKVLHFLSDKEANIEPTKQSPYAFHFGTADNHQHQQEPIPTTVPSNSASTVKEPHEVPKV